MTIITDYLSHELSHLLDFLTTIFGIIIVILKIVFIALMYALMLFLTALFLVHPLSKKLFPEPPRNTTPDKDDKIKADKAKEDKAKKDRPKDDKTKDEKPKDDEDPQTAFVIIFCIMTCVIGFFELVSEFGGRDMNFWVPDHARMAVRILVEALMLLLGFVLIGKSFTLMGWVIARYRGRAGTLEDGVGS